MFFTKKNVLKTLIVAVMLSTSAFAKTAKQADEVFKKWIDMQEIIPERDLASMANHINDDFLLSFKYHYQATAPALLTFMPFLQSVTAGHITDQGYSLKTPIESSLRESLADFYTLLSQGMPEFINLLKSSHILADCYARNNEIGGDMNTIIEQYNSLYSLLFAHPDPRMRHQYLFNLANRFYDYCFSPETFNDFQKLHLTKGNFSITRMLYTTTWFYLAGNGWKTWHQNSLDALKKSADQGKQIVYIAGGSDIYQLIKSGIYNIKNIDPQLPSQPKYYADDWQFLVHGQLGDTIHFTFDDRNIVMERTDVQTPGTSFKVRIATGEIIEIPHSTTTWKISDGKGAKLGQYIIDRRFCNQLDFVKEPQKTVLMSFNELYFIGLPALLGGWGIEPSYFDGNLEIVVKQLHKPITKQHAVNMRIAAMLNATDFKFIALGTCIN